MSEHEILKEICDTIGYDLERSLIFGKCFNWFIGQDDWWDFYYADVREIIFTQEFMDKFFLYRRQAFNIDLNRNVKADMFDHLDDPVSYLYNLLGLWK